MATRATYSFKRENGYGCEVTVYHHWDGYLSGAADLLFNSQTLNPVRTVEEFIRINPKTEITSSHESHGDTQFQYSILFIGRGEARILARERIGFSEDWVTAFYGSLQEFIDHHYEQAIAG